MINSILVLVTSVVSPTDDPLSYSPTRSVYSFSERLQQTKETIESIRSKIPGAQIVLVECSPPELVVELQPLVDKFINLYPNDSIRRTLHKGHGESLMVLAALNEIQDFIPDLIFKISGRYLLMEGFDWESWKTTTIRVSLTNHYGGESVHTFCYAFSGSMIPSMKEFFTQLIEISDPTCIERQFLKRFQTVMQPHKNPMHVLARWSSYNCTTFS